MIASLRRYAYSVSALAVACFFLLPYPYLSVIGALLLQTLAYIMIAGRSSADGYIITGITFIMVGFLDRAHPLMRGDFFEDVRPWILLTGTLIVVLGIVLVIKNSRYHGQH